MRNVVAFLAGLLLASMSSTTLYAQSVTATLTGTVTDPSGAFIPNASITLVQLDTNNTRTAVASNNGDYTFTLLRPGRYDLFAEMKGFRKAAARGLELQVDQTARVDLRLDVGEVSETVEVSAAGTAVASETSSVGQVIDGRQILNLPLRGRTFFELAQLAPGVTPATPGSFIQRQRPMPGGMNAPAFQVSGAREKSNGYLIDGVDAQDPHFLTPSIFPSVDAIQEFKLQTNSYSAEFGRSAAQVNATTRSGGNVLHGSLYHFFRNDKLDAANFFDNLSGRGKAPFRYNQFGGTAGGPITIPKVYSGKDRTFFFASYESTRVRRGSTAQVNVPDVAQRAGNFSAIGVRGSRAIFDPATTRTVNGVVIRDPFPGNIIPTNRITTFGRKVVDLYPLPTLNVPTGNNVFAGLSGASDNDQFLGRVDHRFNEKNSIFFRYSVFQGFEGQPSPIDRGGIATDVKTQNMAMSFIHTFSPTVVWELRMGYNRPTYLILQDGAGEKNYAAELGLKNLLADSIGWGVPSVGITGFTSIGNDSNPTTQTSNVYHLVNHIIVSKGSHMMKFGTDMRKINYNDRSERSVRGSFTFTGGLTADPARNSTTGVSVADLLLGLPLTASGSNVSLAGNFNGFNYGFFAQDDWKIARNLTLNLGLRYDANTRYVDVQNRLSYFDRDFPGGRLLIGGSSKAFIPGTGLVSGPETPRGLLKMDANNWQPRIGLAWRPFGTPRTAVRAGYGIFNDLTELQDLRTFVRNPPFGEVIQLRADQNANSTGSGVLRVDELFPASGTPLARPNVFSPGRSYPDPYYQQWNFSVQQEVLNGNLVEVGYMGSKGTRLAVRLNANQAALDVDPARTTPILSRRPFPLFGDTIRITEGFGNSTYHAGFVKFERRFSKGLSFLASYTLSKSLDQGSALDDQPRDILNAALNKGRASFDIRHRPILSATYELPFGAGKTWLSQPGVARAVLGGWTLNTVGTFRSGFPFTVVALGDVCNCAASGQTAQQVGDPRSGFTQSRLLWYNTAAFAQPTVGRFGTAGRNILDGPGEAVVNLSILREAKLGERMRLQFRSEFFNVLNKTNFGLPGSQVGSATNGQIQSASAARIVQFALKLSF